MKICLPESLNAFVEMPANQRGEGSCGESGNEWIQEDQDHLQLREKLMAGANTATMSPVDATYFDGRRD